MNTETINWEQELNGLFVEQAEQKENKERFNWQELIKEINKLNDLDAFINENEFDVVFA